MLQTKENIQRLYLLSPKNVQMQQVNITGFIKFAIIKNNVVIFTRKIVKLSD